MAQIQVRNWSNESLRAIELSPQICDYPLKSHLIWEAALAYRAAARSGTHKTKNRCEVSGGTRKLWKQKGTGRARMGDNRSPLWRHGGTVQGPTPRSYAWRLPRRMRLNALRSLLADKLRNGQVVCLDRLALDSSKTRELERVVRGSLGIADRTLMLPLEHDRNLELAARNHPAFRVVRAMGVSVIDLLECDTLLVAEDALQHLCEVLEP